MILHYLENRDLLVLRSYLSDILFVRVYGYLQKRSEFFYHVQIFKSQLRSVDERSLVLDELHYLIATQHPTFYDLHDLEAVNAFNYHIAGCHDIQISPENTCGAKGISTIRVGSHAYWKKGLLLNDQVLAQKYQRRNSCDSDQNEDCDRRIQLHIYFIILLINICTFYMPFIFIFRSEFTFFLQKFCPQMCVSGSSRKVFISICKETTLIPQKYFKILNKSSKNFNKNTSNCYLELLNSESQFLQFLLVCDNIFVNSHVLWGVG